MSDEVSSYNFSDFAGATCNLRLGEYHSCDEWDFRFLQGLAMDSNVYWKIEEKGGLMQLRC